MCCRFFFLFSGAQLGQGFAACHAFRFTTHETDFFGLFNPIEIYGIENELDRSPIIGHTKRNMKIMARAICKFVLDVCIFVAIL